MTALQRVDPRQAVLEVRPLQAQVDDWLGDRRALGRLLWAIALAALSLAATGMYATLSFAVGRRLLAGSVYGVPAVDLQSLTIACALLLVACLLASTAAALRAVRENPARLMREDQLG